MRSSVQLTVVLLVFALLFAPHAVSLMPVQAQSPTITSRILFVSGRDGNEEIYLMNGNGNNPTNLSNHPARDWHPRWSPDRRRVAFTTDRDGNEEIYVMNLDGSEAVNLSANPAPDNAPMWSPDGSQIAWASERNGWDIWVMNADGSNPQRVTTDGAIKTDPSWSPDGTRLAYWAVVGGNSEIFVVNADGSGQTRLTQNSANDGWPRWVGHNELVFDTFRDGNWEVYTLTIDSGGTSNRSRNPATDGRPAWSNYDRLIAFTSDRDGNKEIYTMYLNGTGVNRLTNNNAPDHSPDWEPVPPDPSILALTAFVQLAYTPDQFFIQNPVEDRWMYLFGYAVTDSAGTRLLLRELSALTNDPSLGTIDRLPPDSCILLTTPNAVNQRPVQSCQIIARVTVPNAFWQANFTVDGSADDRTYTCNAAVAGSLTLCITAR